MAGLTTLDSLLEEAMPALSQLYFAVKRELELEKHMGSAGKTSSEFQAVLQNARAPVRALLDLMSDGDDMGNLTPVPVGPAPTAPKLNDAVRELKASRHGYRLVCMSPLSVLPEGYQLAIVGSTEQLGEWDETKAERLNPLKVSTSFLQTSLLPAPESNERVEFRWVFIGEGGTSTIFELEIDSETKLRCKFVDVEPDLWGLPRGLECCMLCPGWGLSGRYLGKCAAPQGGDPILPTAQIKTTGPRKRVKDRHVWGFALRRGWVTNTLVQRHRHVHRLGQ